MINLKMPNWAQGSFFVRLLNAAQAWFEKVAGWIAWPLEQLDVATCHVALLDAYAYQRYVNKITGEPLSLYRLRIQTAFINAKEAGTINGLKNILQRLGIDIISINQKVDGRHWAVVEIEVSQVVLSQFGAVIQELMSTYGKLCRTYEIKVISPLALNVRVASKRYKSKTIIAK